MELGATFWPGNSEALLNAEKLFAEFGITQPARIVSPWRDRTFFFLAAPLELAHRAWKMKQAAKEPPFLWILPSTAVFGSEQSSYRLGKKVISIFRPEREILIPDFFSDWISVPKVLTHWQAPGALTLRTDLPVTQKFLREIVVLCNGQVFFPLDRVPKF